MIDGITRFSVLSWGLLVLGCGCATHPVMTDERYPNVHIASGILERDPSKNGHGDAVYRLTKIHRGHFPTNDFVHVSFHPGSVPAAGLPDKALLILQHKFYEDGHIQIPGKIQSNVQLLQRYYDALGGDAYRGILPDTPGNEAMIAARSLESLSQNSWWQRIPRRRALKIAEQAIKAREGAHVGERLEISAMRESYGWWISAYYVLPNGHSITGGDINITIGDDGLIKKVFGGL